jgi:hypothetical protein
MEDRCGDLYLELTNLSPEAYEDARLGEVLKREDVAAATLWRNQRPMRDDYERTIPEFETLTVYEVGDDFAMPNGFDDHRGHHFRRVPRPAQGILTGTPTLGLEIVLVSPVTPGGAQALRDWADFLHIREIASAAVPGFTMITPYENAAGGSPRYLHLYEMDTADADQAFQQMAPHTIERVRRSGKAAVREWMGHPELQIDYINAFARVGDLRR